MVSDSPIIKLLYDMAVLDAYLTKVLHEKKSVLIHFDNICCTLNILSQTILSIIPENM